MVDLEEALHITRRNLRPYLKLMKDAGMIHVAGWQQKTGPALPLWKLGAGKDKPRPATIYKRLK